jgi:hypothetical protein
VKLSAASEGSPELTYLLPAVLVLTTATRRTIENDSNANYQQRYRMLHWEFMFTADAAAADWIIVNISEINLGRKKVSGNRQVRSPKSKVPVSTSITDNEGLIKNVIKGVFAVVEIRSKFISRDISSACKFCYRTYQSSF